MQLVTAYVLAALLPATLKFFHHQEQWVSLIVKERCPDAWESFILCAPVHSKQFLVRLRLGVNDLTKVQHHCKTSITFTFSTVWCSVEHIPKWGPSPYKLPCVIAQSFAHFHYTSTSDLCRQKGPLLMRPRAHMKKLINNTFPRLFFRFDSSANREPLVSSNHTQHATIWTTLNSLKGPNAQVVHTTITKPFYHLPFLEKWIYIYPTKRTPLLLPSSFLSTIFWSRIVVYKMFLVFYFSKLFEQHCML